MWLSVELGGDRLGCLSGIEIKCWNRVVKFWRLVEMVFGSGMRKEGFFTRAYSGKRRERSREEPKEESYKIWFML